MLFWLMRGVVIPEVVLGSLAVQRVLRLLILRTLAILRTADIIWYVFTVHIRLVSQASIELLTGENVYSLDSLMSVYDKCNIG